MRIELDVILALVFPLFFSLYNYIVVAGYEETTELSKGVVVVVVGRGDSYFFH